MVSTLVITVGVDKSPYYLQKYYKETGFCLFSFFFLFFFRSDSFVPTPSQKFLHNFSMVLRTYGRPRETKRESFCVFLSFVWRGGRVDVEATPSMFPSLNRRYKYKHQRAQQNLYIANWRQYNYTLSLNYL